jgi:hypothetical protein
MRWIWARYGAVNVSENLISMADLPVELARSKKIKVKTKHCLALPHTSQSERAHVVHTAKLLIETRGINQLDDIDNTGFGCLIYGAERLHAINKRYKMIEIDLWTSILSSMLMNVIFTSLY